MLKAEHLTFAYPNQSNLIQDLQITIPEHQITTLVGPNGSGKSTLLQLLTRQLPPANGTVSLDGKNLWEMDAKTSAQKIAVVHQQHQLYDEMTVKDLVQLGRLPYQSSLFSDLDKENTATILHQLNLTELATKPVNQLSGGQAQRVWLALALNQHPQYLFLDEPTTYLDLHYQASFLTQLKALNQATGLTIVMILHDLNQALRYSDYCCLLANGQLVTSGNPHEVLTAERVASTFKINCDLVQTDHGTILVQY